MAEAPFDVPRAHRWFGVEFNNLAWDLVEKPERSDEESAQMIHAAHASCLHWQHVGAAINQLRGECLLATAYAAAGLFEAAGRHAERGLELSREVEDEQTAFDRATALGCAARAYAGLGRMDAARECYQEALRAAEGLEAEDRGVFERLYPALEYRL